jgi:F-type H+-transporting ATPase subunit a
MTLLAGMSRRRQITYIILLAYLAGLIALGLVFGIHTHRNNSFNIVSPYQLVTWVHLVGPLDINKGVLYLLMTGALTIGILLFVARRMEMRPNRVQTAVEWGYDLTRRLATDSMDSSSRSSCSSSSPTSSGTSRCPSTRWTRSTPAG